MKPVIGTPAEWEEFERRRSEVQPVAHPRVAGARAVIDWFTEHEAALRRLWPDVLTGDIAAAEKVLKLTREAAEVFGSR